MSLSRHQSIQTLHYLPVRDESLLLVHAHAVDCVADVIMTLSVYAMVIAYQVKNVKLETRYFAKYLPHFKYNQNTLNNLHVSSIPNRYCKHDACSQGEQCDTT